MFVKINDVDVNATLISTFYKSEGEPYQITYYMLSGSTLVEEFSNASDMNDKYELVSELSIGSGGGGSANVYTYKGSCLFASLPVSDNEVGDVWNIEDDFTLGGKDYPAGTNVAWDGTGWDALAGNIPYIPIMYMEGGSNHFLSYNISNLSNSERESLVNTVQTIYNNSSRNKWFYLVVHDYSSSIVYFGSLTAVSDSSISVGMSCFSSTGLHDVRHLPFHLPTGSGGSLIQIDCSVSSGVVQSNISINATYSHYLLYTDNSTSFTPTGDYNPATKKYVDDSLLNIAPLYDATATYDLGDLVIYNALLYKCATAIAVAEAWDSTHWTRTTVFEVLGSVNTALSALTTPGNGGGN